MPGLSARIAALERRRVAVDAPAITRLAASCYRAGEPLPPGLAPAELDLARYYQAVLASIDSDWFDRDNPAPLPSDEPRHDAL